MKLIVMIPCLNEESTLPLVVQTIPKDIPGIDSIETLIIDDGSNDDTIGVAKRLGVHHIIKLKHHMGLARAFQTGLDACLDLGADVIVNTDGDNQYPSESIPLLVRPILMGEADIVVGDRQTQTIAEFSPLKRLLQRTGSWAVKKLSGAAEVNDAVSGFRAYSRYAASRNCLTNSYSYTIESLMHASKRGLRIVSVPITTKPKTRPSRLMKSLHSFVTRSAAILIKSYLMHEPLKIFALMGSLSFMIGSSLGIFLIYSQIVSAPDIHMLMPALAVTFLLIGVMLVAFGLMGDHIAANRKLLEELVWREKLINRGQLNTALGTGGAYQQDSVRPVMASYEQSQDQEMAEIIHRLSNRSSRLPASPGS